MTHDIADALTADEARAVVSAMLHNVAAHDDHGRTRWLHRDLLATVRMAETLAHGVPDMPPNYGDVDLPEVA